MERSKSPTTKRKKKSPLSRSPRSRSPSPSRSLSSYRREEQEEQEEMSPIGISVRPSSMFKIKDLAPKQKDSNKKEKEEEEEKDEEEEEEEDQEQENEQEKEKRKEEKRKRKEEKKLQKKEEKRKRKEEKKKRKAQDEPEDEEEEQEEKEDEDEDDEKKKRKKEKKLQKKEEKRKRKEEKRKRKSQDEPEDEEEEEEEEEEEQEEEGKEQQEEEEDEEDKEEQEEEVEQKERKQRKEKKKKRKDKEEEVKPPKSQPTIFFPKNINLENLLTSEPRKVSLPIIPVESSVKARTVLETPKNVIIPYQQPKSYKKGMSGSVKKTKKEISPKPVKESKYTQEECEMFIQASKTVENNQKFKNPITGKDITKGSASYVKYLRDCKDKFTESTATQMKTEFTANKSRFGIHKIYTCEDYPKSTGKIFQPNLHQIKAQNRFKQILEEPEQKNQRGLLLYYGLGSGKTCTYAMIADTYRRKYPDRPVFIFTPGSLRTNFLEQYCSFCGLNPKDVAKHFIFFTLNDTSIMRKLPANFNESLVIIDEVHKLTHGKTNESGVLSNIYDTINNSKNMNLVSGSGTPIETNIEELFYLTNLHLEDQFATLSDFKNSFIKEKYKDPVQKDEFFYYPKNKNQLEKILSSFISYYDPEKQLAESGDSGFPKVFYQHVDVPINPEREQKLIQKVLDENERMKPPNEALKFTDLEKYKNQKSLYYTASSRLVSSQFSNYEYPRLKESDFKDAVRNPLTKREKEIEKEKLEQIQNEADLPLETEEGSEMTIDEINQEILGKQDKDTAVGMKIMDLPKADGGWITEEEIENLQDAGEKIDEILLDITGDEGEGKHAIYTRFKTYYGSRLLGSLLDLKGISYVFFDGDMDDNDRIKVLERFNSPENINGDKIKVIILTSAGSAGINLKEIRRFHILEQYFNLSYMKQVIGRGVRYLSHERLPLHKRNITIRNYFLNLATPEQTKIYSPDYSLYDLAKSKDRKIAKIRELIQTFGV
jgi:hypothetical protein